MTNTNCLAGMCCPKCKSLGPFDIVVTAVATVFDSGTDDVTEVEWDDNSACICRECRHDGSVRDFKEE